MKKIIFASHYTFAKGLKDTIEYIIPNAPKIIAISAYLDNKPIEDEIKDVMDTMDPKDEVGVFTDLMSGSVIQHFVPYVKKNNIYLISGASVPAVMAVILGSMNEKLSDVLIRRCLKDAQNQLVYVNDALKVIDDEDE